jgi:hypothetical protein
MKGGVINLAAKRDERDADRYRPWQAERLLEEFEAARGRPAANAQELTEFLKGRRPKRK